MKARCVRAAFFAILVLPAMALRALIPAGFMAASVEGAWQIVLCQPDGIAGAHHHHHHHTPQSPCPYAQSAGPALLPTVPLMPAAADVHSERPAEAISQTRLTFGPPRRQFPRGPPALA